MLSKELEKALNEQINFEIYSSYSYLAMASYVESLDLSGFGNFFRVQVQEELFHAMKFYDYILQKGGNVEHDAINRPNQQFNDIIDVFQKGLEHEQEVTRRIYNLADLANEEKDHATISLLRWFIDEQVEEENSFSTILKKVKRCNDNPAALYMLDDELATRIFTPPTTK
ncbi:ferritin [Romboutsia sp.]|uniref:ferritin n=1 Tax=Romboutsia sp. TaxID=1965302 RepID=UPI003F2ACFAC